MEYLIYFVIIAIIFSYLNLWLIIRKENPTIIIKNILPGNKEEDEQSKYLRKYSESTSEIPIESNVTIRSVKGEVNLDSEKVGSSNVSDLTHKIKKVRGK